MAMIKGKEGLETQRWFNFSKDSAQLFQPYGTDWVVDVHAVKTRQGFIINPPCTLDDLDECRLCSRYETRKLFFQKGLDHRYQPLEPRILQLPKVGASRFYKFVDETKVEPLSTVFKIARFGEGFNTMFGVAVEEEDVAPALEIDDMQSILNAWMQPEHLERVVPYYKDLKVVTKAGRAGFESEGQGSYVEIDDPEI